MSEAELNINTDSSSLNTSTSNILVPVDDSASSHAAFLHALRSSNKKQRILLFHAHGESIYADCDGTILPIPLGEKKEPDLSLSLEARHLRECTEHDVCV